MLGTGVFSPAILRAATSGVKIGYVTPQSGPLAPFAEADKYVIDTMTKLIGGGVTGAGGNLPISIVVKDSQSDPNRAAEAAKSLITDDKVDLIVVASTPETTIPYRASRNRRKCPASRHGAVAALVHRPPGEPRRPEKLDGLQVHLPLFLGPRRHHRGLFGDVESARHQQAGRRAFPERQRRQRLGDPTSASRPASRRTAATPSPIPAATRTSTTTSQRRSRPSRPPRPTSSPAW